MTITVKIIPKYTEGPNKGQDWSPLTEAHCRVLVEQAMRRTGLYYEITVEE